MTFTASNGLQIRPTERGGVYITGATSAGNYGYAPNVEPDETQALREYFEQEDKIELPTRSGAVLSVGPTRAHWMLTQRGWVSLLGISKTPEQMVEFVRANHLTFAVIA